MGERILSSCSFGTLVQTAGAVFGGRITRSHCRGTRFETRAGSYCNPATEELHLSAGSNPGLNESVALGRASGLKPVPNRSMRTR